MNYIPFKWELISGYNSIGGTRRVKVLGGWIVNDFDNNGNALVFIPDPTHEWKVEDGE